MAVLKNGVQFTGSLSGLSAYTMKGFDKIIFRTKGGPSKQQIKKSPNFERTRENYTEFSGCAKAGSSIHRALFPVKHLADHNFMPTLSAISKRIQLLDKEGKRGERSIRFSQHRYLLEGFHLNKNTPLDNVVRHPIYCNIDRATASAEVKLPRLLPQINLFTSGQYPLYRFILSLSIIADLEFNGTDFTGPNSGFPQVQSLYTEWHPVRQTFEAQTLEISMGIPNALDDNKSLLLAVGIEMGLPVTNALTEGAGEGGCAKILGVG